MVINRTLVTELESQQVSPATTTPTYQSATPELAAGMGLGAVKDAAVLQRITDGRLSRAGDALLQLQRSHGNRHVQQMIVQAKMLLGPVHDPYEQEADRMARQVVQGQQSHQVQRQVVGDGGTAVMPEIESAINQARGGGRPLPQDIRVSMEQIFDADFSGVHIHTDGRAGNLNNALQARAFTTGQNIFFNQGEYQPGSQQGKGLIAHELTHVMQQNRGSVQRQDNLTGPALTATQGENFYIQAQHATGLANSAALTAVNWTNILANTAFRTYIRDNAPAFAAQTPDAYGGTTYTLTWNNAVSFTDGSYGTVKMHIHEDQHEDLSGGGAWVDGGAVGHGINLGNIPRRPFNICVAWLTEHYAWV